MVTERITYLVTFYKAITAEAAGSLLEEAGIRRRIEDYQPKRIRMHLTPEEADRLKTDKRIEIVLLFSHCNHGSIQ